MKKILLALAVVFSCSAVSAQKNAEERAKGVVSKSGRHILPQAGDYAIGIDAAAGFSYLGNFLNNSTNNSIGNFFSAPNDALNDYDGFDLKGQTIFIKYFYKDDVAVRARINIGFDSKKSVKDVLKTNTDNQWIEDATRVSAKGLGLDFGYEMRRGYGRLQGFFGPQVALGFGGQSTSRTYGNALSTDNQGIHNLLDSRSFFRFGVGGFAGIEYFVLPKVSIAGELGCDLGFKSYGKTKTKSERWEDNKIVSKDDRKGGSSNFNFRTNYSATLAVNFYF